MPSAKAQIYPFLFIGQGFRTSYKCLECFAWFVRAPTPDERRRVVEKIPLPLTNFVAWDGDVLKFASDDLLETYVKAAYDPTYAKMSFKKAVEALDVVAQEKGFQAKKTLPTTKQWAAFCDDFEHSMNDIHTKTRLRLVLKNDLDGESKTGPWHRWSVKESYQIADLALTEGRKFSGLFVRLLQCVLPEGGRVQGWAPSARRTWLSWLDVQMTKMDRDLRDVFGSRDRRAYRESLVRRARTLVESFPKKEQAALIKVLRPSTRRALAKNSVD
jgi:hypothetical protein